MTEYENLKRKLEQFNKLNAEMKHEYLLFKTTFDALKEALNEAEKSLRGAR